MPDDFLNNLPLGDNPETDELIGSEQEEDAVAEQEPEEVAVTEVEAEPEQAVLDEEPQPEPEETESTPEEAAPQQAPIQELLPKSPEQTLPPETPQPVAAETHVPTEFGRVIGEDHPRHQREMERRKLRSRR